MTITDKRNEMKKLNTEVDFHKGMVMAYKIVKNQLKEGLTLEDMEFHIYAAEKTQWEAEDKREELEKVKTKRPVRYIY